MKTMYEPMSTYSDYADAAVTALNDGRVAEAQVLATLALAIATHMQ